MEKFKRYMNILDKGLSAIGIAFLVISIVMLAFAVIGFIGIEGVVIGEIETVLRLDVLELEIAPEEILTLEKADTVLAIGALLLAVQFVISWVLVKVLRNLIAPMKEGQVFDESVCKSIRTLAIYVLVGGLLSEIIAVAERIVAVSVFDISSFFNPEVIINTAYNFEIDGTCVVYAAVIYLLSYIFKYGLELQTQVDETL